jgi:hypothetical protein
VNNAFHISITETGRAVLTSKKIPVAYSDIAAFVPEAFVLAVLQYLTKSTSSVGEATAAMAGVIEKSWIEFGLLWMAKYSLIRITPPHS